MTVTVCPIVTTISIHALREEGDLLDGGFDGLREISIHALREEGDPSSRTAATASLDFYPRPPRGGRHSENLIVRVSQIDFYPRPPRGGRQAIVRSPFFRRINFYPRPPRGGRPTTLSSSFAIS